MAEYQSIAYKTLDSKIESIRMSSFDSIDSASFSIPEIPNGQGTVVVSTEVDSLPQVDIKQIDVTINWNFKKSYQARATTYVTKGGIQK